MVSSTTVRKDWKSNKADMLRCQQRLQDCVLPAQLLKVVDAAPAVGSHCT
jgi:hypothetical protein